MNCTALAASVLLLIAACRAASEGPPALVPIALPNPRHGHRIEKVNGGLLSFGGFGDPSAPERGARQTWWLAPGANQWQRRADMQRERAFFFSVTADGSAYAIGESIERYDFAADRWTEITPAGSLPVSHFAAAAIGHELFVLGGYRETDPETMVVVDLTSGAARTAPAPPGHVRGDHFHFVVALDGHLHVIGGLDGKSLRPKLEHWELAQDTWRALPPPPAGLWAKFAVQALSNGALYLFGDFGAFRFDPGTGVWTACARMPLMLVMPQAIAIDGAIWVIGGMPVDGGRKAFLLRYEIAADRWVDCSEQQHGQAVSGAND